MRGSAMPFLIYETVHGSRAYGLEIPGSDTDTKGVLVPDARVLLGWRGGPEQEEPTTERVLYDVRKLFRLAAACNPTVIELLFTDPADHLTATSAGERLLAHRHAFLSRRAGDSFGRYGLAQCTASARTGAGCCNRRGRSRPARRSGCLTGPRSPATRKERPWPWSRTTSWRAPCRRASWTCWTASGATAARCANGSSTRPGSASATRRAPRWRARTATTRNMRCTCCASCAWPRRSCVPAKSTCA